MAYPSRPKYTLLKNADSDTEKLARPANSPARRESTCSITLQLLTFLIAAATLTATVMSSAPVPTSLGVLPRGMNRINPTVPHALKPCGQTAGEARAAGCIFDLLTLAWLAPECYDADLSTEFLEEASEPFYYDPDGRHQIENYDILSERQEYSWTTRKYHMYHCVYGWRMMHKMIEKGAMLESGLSSYHHTEHCTDNLLNQSNTPYQMDRVMTRVEIMYPDC